MPGGWEGSKRRDGLPSWWPVTVRRILKRDPTCRCEGCPRCFDGGPIGGHRPRQPGCIRPSQECDHIGDPQNHKDDNLRGMCRPCHGRRSSEQGNEAKRERRRPTGFLAEKHPGDLFS